jgi:diadenosine tetraphosphate (Ap4A) HIT family hydrolase
MKEVLQTKRIGIHVEGLQVPHVHYHVIAFDTAEEYRQIPDESKEPDHEALAAMAKRLAF